MSEQARLDALARYTAEWTQRAGFSGFMERADDGEWVRYEDALRLQQERDNWMASSAGYGSDAVEWKIRAEAAEAALSRLPSSEAQGTCATTAELRSLMQDAFFAGAVSEHTGAAPIHERFDQWYPPEPKA